MVLMRKIALYALAIISVVLLIALLICWLLDKPLYFRATNTVLDDNDKMINELNGGGSNEEE